MSVKEREEEPFGLGVGTLAGGLIGLFGGPAGVAAVSPWAGWLEAGAPCCTPK